MNATLDLNVLNFLIHLREQGEITEAVWLKYHFEYSKQQIELMAKEQGIVEVKKQDPAWLKEKN